jgi:hypothetical protein
VPVSWLVQQNGRLNSPWIIQVNLTNPEANRDFDVQFVPGIDTDKCFSRDGFFICRSIAAPDFKLWSASIPQGYNPEYAKRIILFKGPSQDFWRRTTERFHGTGKVDCTATKNAHSATEIAIEKNEERQTAFYLMCFPPGVILENQIFSRDEEDVPTNKNPMKSTAKQNMFEKDLRAMVLYWKIAVKGGVKIGKQVSNERDKDMFD